MPELNRIFRAIDEIVKLHRDVFKVETVGPEYLCSVGVFFPPSLWIHCFRSASNKISNPNTSRTCMHKNMVHGDAMCINTWYVGMPPGETCINTLYIGMHVAPTWCDVHKCMVHRHAHYTRWHPTVAILVGRC